MTRPRFTLSRRRRQRVEALIAHLVDLLDATAGDPDLEDSPDAEADLCDREPCNEDDEHSLQPPVTRDSTRPTLPLPVQAFRTLPGGKPEPVTVQIVPAVLT